MKNKFKYCLLFFCFVYIKVFATHIVGGELNYHYIGNNQYEISLTVYRDCKNGVPLLDNPAYVFVFDAFNNLFTTVLLPLDDKDTIPSTINSPCFTPRDTICYEHSHYQKVIVTLPPSVAGYQLAYQRCCRNNTILNIVSPGASGATFYAFIPGTSIFSQNSNPVYDSLPPPFICLNIPFVFDHSATDADGDSIVYELCNPFLGASSSVPQPTLSPDSVPDPPVPLFDGATPIAFHSPLHAVGCDAPGARLHPGQNPSARTGTDRLSAGSSGGRPHLDHDQERVPEGARHRASSR